MLTSCHVDFSWTPLYHVGKKKEKYEQHITYPDENSTNTQRYLKQKFEELTTIPAADSFIYTKV
jgi:hypothetical protein